MEDAIEIDIPRRFLGFNIPGMSPEDTLHYFKTNFTKVGTFFQVRLNIRKGI